jgi:heme O synthase-like polyprenyltransferase
MFAVVGNGEQPNTLLTLILGWQMVHTLAIALPMEYGCGIVVVLSVSDST